MKNIFKIFFTDLKGLIKNPFAMIIALGICILPSLYAWFNIYSNWDPYANTGNIKIAIYSEDKGITTDDGSYKNIGKDVVEELKHNKKVGWTQVKSRDEAESGVESGLYYAAVVISSDFTDALYNGPIMDFKDNPTITYYENEKKNAVATKITDTAVDSLKNSINEQFLNVIFTSVFDETNSLINTTKDGKNVTIQDKVNSLSNNLTQYSNIIDSLIKSNSSLSTVMKNAQSEAGDISSSIGKASDKFDDTNKKLSETQVSVKDFNNTMTNTLNQVEASINSISKEIEDAKLNESATDMTNQINSILKNASTLNSYISEIEDSLSKTKDTSINSINNSESKLTPSQINDQTAIIKNIYDNPIKTISFIKEGVDKIDSELQPLLNDSINSINLDITKRLDSCADTASNISSTYSNTLVPQIDSVMNNINDAMSSATNMLNTLSNASKNMGEVFGTASSTILTTNSTLNEIKSVVDNMNERIKDFQAKFDDNNTKDYIDNLIKFLKGDPNEYGSYLASPVSIDTKKIYPVDFYGSAMTPFYTVLAIWVGITILVSIVKVNAEPKKLTNVKSYHLYFGRLLTFLLLSMLQTMIIVLGDIYLLKCQILNPVLFTTAAITTSITFTILIYSLTISFGDIGKAVAVIIMVIQIAGSSGTFPIELLPSMYQHIYIFFPFPYAINAMRETIGGLYGVTYIRSLSELILFAFAGLFIGLIIRIPFVGINHYMEKRMKDTKMM